MSVIEINLVSVIMPAYNGQRFVKQAIESVLAQTYSNWELIVINDGSTDNTAHIVSAFKDSRIRYVYQKNMGQAVALNRGLDLARGDYVTTLDVDDWFTSNSLADRISFLDSNSQYEVVYGDGIYCDVDGKSIRRFSELRTGEIVGDVYDALISNAFFGTGANVMIRKKVFDDHRIRYDESIVWCQDYDLYLRLAEKFAFGYVHTITMWYRLHGANMTMSMPKGRRLDSLIRTKYKILNSPRFNSVATPFKISFFFQFLIHDLEGHLDDQMRVLEDPHFLILPKQQRARLMRLAASYYLLIGENINFVRDWLGKAWFLAPLDLKLVLVTAMAYMHPSLTAWIIRWWRRRADKHHDHKPPFELLKDLYEEPYTFI